MNLLLFLCPTCRREHNEPAEAHLGHLVLCLDCALDVPVVDPSEIRSADARTDTYDEPVAA